MEILDKKRQPKFIQGNAACAQAAIDGGVRFFGGYPITPSSEIAEILSKKLPLVGGKFIQMEDEIGGIGAVLGASLTGVKALTATSGPGFSLKQELIGFASLCEIPCVIVNIQRGGPSTGLPTSPSQSDVMQSRWGTHGEHPIIVLAPASVKDMYELTIAAINFSESLRVPVILLSDEVVGHLYEKIEFPQISDIKLLERPKPKNGPNKNYLPFFVKGPKDVPRIANFGEGYHFNVTGLIHDLDGFPTSDKFKTDALLKRLHIKLESRLKDICLFDAVNLKSAKTILCSYGSTSRSCAEIMQMAESEGLNLGLITLKTLWPFPDFIFKKLGDHVKSIIVCEMNMGQIKREVQRASGGRIEVFGVNSINGVLITPQEILKKVKEVV